MKRKPFYADDVKQDLRVYSRSFVDGNLRSYPADQDGKKSWRICDEVLSGLSDQDKSLLLDIYGAMDTLADNVYRVATKRSVEQDHIWSLINNTEKRVARMRGLI